MTLKTPLFMQKTGADPDIEFSALDLRALFGGIYNQPGVLNTNTSGDLKVTQRGAGANLTVDVLAGLALVAGTDVSDQGLYLVQSTATENLVIPAPPVSGTRIHRVVARVRDKLHDGTQTTYDWVLEVLADTDGSGPPTVPDSAISLATVTVTSATVSITDSNITDTRQNAAMGSGRVRARQVGSDSERPANPWPSEEIWRTDKGYSEVYDGSGWRVLGPLPAAVHIEQTTTISGFSNTSFSAGSPVCGMTFTAPPSGRVYVTVTGRLQSSINTEQAYLGWEIRTGGVVGSGTITWGAHENLSLITSRAVNTAAAAYIAASHRHLVTGLAAGTHNIRTMHKISGGNGTIERRYLLIEPAP